MPTLWEKLMEWVSFLDDHHIPYVTRGQNTKKGEISVKCPWCGIEDTSQHLGINLTHDAWGCHRNQAHRGKSLTYLIQALLGCSKSQAGLVLTQYGAADPDTFGVAPAPSQEKPTTLEPLVMPYEFRTIRTRSDNVRFIKYLHRRGFDDVDKVGRQYDLRYCTTGRWKDRIIFPIVRNGKLIAWTGRAIGNPINAPRYLSTSNLIKTCLFNEDEIFLGGKLLFITEGPIDAVKIDYYGRPKGAAATCVFGTSITIDQIALLRRVSKKFQTTVLLFDPEAVETSFNMLEWLPEAVLGVVPEGAEDPGAMSKEQVLKLTNSHL